MIPYELKEACGVFGVFSPAPYGIVFDVQLGLFALQHRGEESAGFAISAGESNHLLSEYGDGCAGYARFFS
jgi:amidophosphoribosyltransferase